MRRARISVLVGLVFLAIVAPCLGHDFWLEPTSFRPRPGAAVGVGLLVGEHFLGDPLPRNESLIERFVVVGPRGEATVAGVDGVHPAGVFVPSDPGLYLVGYVSGASLVEMTAETFDGYLEQEGLRSQLSSGSPPRGPVRDSFSRCAKAMIWVSGGDSGAQAAAYDHALGLPLELVAEVDPHTMVKAGDGPSGGFDLPIQLLKAGVPLSGVQVTALDRGDPTNPRRALTDRDGRVFFELSGPGPWLIKAVTIEQSPLGALGDYRSRWASLTFEKAP